MQLRTILPRAAGAVLRENDGTDFNTNRGLFGVLFSLEDVRGVHSEADDGTRGDFERGDGTNRDGLGDVFRAERRADVGVREYLLELRVVDFFAASTKSVAWQIGDSGKIEEMSGEELRQAVNELMAELLSDFPPKG